MKVAICLFSIILSVSVSAKIRLMTYNVENLFDSLHDPGKEDFTFTALGTPGRKEYCETIEVERWKKSCLKNDWNSKRVKIKLAQIKKVVKAAGKIDILALSEVENENIVGQLAKKLGFKNYVMTNSPDKRGIDVALLYNEKKDLKFVEFQDYRIEGAYFNKRPTRDILEAVFTYKKKKLSIFVNHWPSQAAPGWVRTKVAQQIKPVIDEKMKQGHHVIVTGDFNVIEGDHPHPFKKVFYQGNKDYRLMDVHRLHLSKLREIDYKLTFKVPMGTYFYAPRMEWNLLDRFFISPSLIDGLSVEADIDSYQIFSTDFMRTTYFYGAPDSFNFGTQINNIPKRSNHNTDSYDLAGFSDHYPIILEIK